MRESKQLKEWIDEAKFQALTAEALSRPDDIEMLLPCTNMEEDPLCVFTKFPTCAQCRIMYARIVAEEWMNEN